MRGSRHNKQQAVMRGGQPQHEPLTPPCAPVAIAVPCRAARRRAQARCRRRPGGGGVYGRQQTGVRAGVPSRRMRRIGRPAPKRERSTRTHRRMRARTDRAARRLRIRRSTAPSRHLRNASNKRYGIRWAFMAFIQRFFSVKSCIFLSSFRVWVCESTTAAAGGGLERRRRFLRALGAEKAGFIGENVISPKSGSATGGNKWGQHAPDFCTPPPRGPYGTWLLRWSHRMARFIAPSAFSP